MGKNLVLRDLEKQTKRAVAHYWQTRAAQGRRQAESGKADQGLRSAVTGGAQMDGFIDLFKELIAQAGIPQRYVFRKKGVELPGFFRPTKVGYFFMVEDSEASNRPVRVPEPHFKVFPEFVGASYIRRYELFCRKLVLERHYTASAFITSRSQQGLRGRYKTPARDLSLERFAKLLVAHATSFG